MTNFGLAAGNQLWGGLTTRANGARTSYPRTGRQARSRAFSRAQSALAWCHRAHSPAAGNRALAGNVGGDDLRCAPLQNFARRPGHMIPAIRCVTLIAPRTKLDHRATRGTQSGMAPAPVRVDGAAQAQNGGAQYRRGEGGGAVAGHFSAHRRAHLVRDGLGRGDGLFGWAQHNGGLRNTSLPLQRRQPLCGQRIIAIGLHRLGIPVDGLIRLALRLGNLAKPIPGILRRRIARLQRGQIAAFGLCQPAQTAKGIGPLLSAADSVGTSFSAAE